MAFDFMGGDSFGDDMDLGAFGDSIGGLSGAEGEFEDDLGGGFDDFDDFGLGGKSKKKNKKKDKKKGKNNVELESDEEDLFDYNPSASKKPEPVADDQPKTKKKGKKRRVYQKKEPVVSRQQQQLNSSTKPLTDADRKMQEVLRAAEHKQSQMKQQLEENDAEVGSLTFDRQNKTKTSADKTAENIYHRHCDD